MGYFDNRQYQVAIPKTLDGNGIADAMFHELVQLGHRPVFFRLDSRVPPGADIILLFGPFGKFLHIPQQFDGLPRGRRPVLAYWNTEGLPDLRLPRRMVGAASQMRSWVDRLAAGPGGGGRLAGKRPFSMIERRMLRFRYLGDYLYAQRMGWVDVFADISAVYAGYFRKFGIPAIVAPFGSFRHWYADLRLERDIDVLWLGKRATPRRSAALDRLREQLGRYGIHMLVVDNTEHPFVFGHDRTELLNRAKITLNLLRTWYDENSLRICIAAPNRSMVVSEPLLPHVPQYEPGVHYAAEPVEELADTIRYYIENEAERKHIVENAYTLTTSELTFRNSMKTIMEAATAVREGRALWAEESGQPAAQLFAAGRLVSQENS